MCDGHEPVRTYFQNSRNKIFTMCPNTPLNLDNPVIKMNENILRHLPDYGILVCTLCQNNHAVPLEGMAKHFREFHSESVSKKQRRELVKYANTFKAVSADPNTVKRIIPAFENAPIDGLHKITGFQCMTCKKLLPELSTMQIHCRTHGWKEKRPAMWMNQWMQVRKPLDTTIDGQTFFTAPQYQNFFPIQLLEDLASIQPSQQCIQALLARTKAKEQERESARHIMDDEINKVDQFP